MNEGPGVGQLETPKLQFSFFLLKPTSERLVAARKGVRRFAQQKLSKRSDGRYLVTVSSVIFGFYSCLGRSNLTFHATAQGRKSEVTLPKPTFIGKFDEDSPRELA
jgi:hypothetical protein